MKWKNFRVATEFYRVTTENPATWLVLFSVLQRDFLRFLSCVGNHTAFCDFQRKRETEKRPFKLGRPVNRYSPERKIPRQRRKKDRFPVQERKTAETIIRGLFAELEDRDSVAAQKKVQR
jgi:hypothetical protein